MHRRALLVGAALALAAPAAARAAAPPPLASAVLQAPDVPAAFRASARTGPRDLAATARLVRVSTATARREGIQGSYASVFSHDGGTLRSVVVVFRSAAAAHATAGSPQCDLHDYWAYPMALGSDAVFCTDGGENGATMSEYAIWREGRYWLHVSYTGKTALLKGFDAGRLAIVLDARVRRALGGGPLDRSQPARVQLDRLLAELGIARSDASPATADALDPAALVLRRPDLPGSAWRTPEVGALTSAVAPWLFALRPEPFDGPTFVRGSFSSFSNSGWSVDARAGAILDVRSGVAVFSSAQAAAAALTDCDSSLATRRIGLGDGGVACALGGGPTTEADLVVGWHDGPVAAVVTLRGTGPLDPLAMRNYVALVESRIRAAFAG